MLEAIRLEYRPASEESPPWDGREGGYQAHDYDLLDLLEGHLRDDFGCPDVIGAIEDALIPYLEPWFDRDWYALRPHQQYLASWQRFARIASRRRDDNARPHSRSSRDPDDRFDTDEVLDALGELIAELPETFDKLPSGTVLWRARYGPPCGFRTAATLGPPPADAASPAGRMNRKGQTWFYGALNRETAVVEKFRTRERRSLSIGPFRTTRSLVVLDLTARSLSEPSIYDLERQHGRIGVRFLRSFADEIALPVRRTESPRYVPTQLVTEYVRTELEASTGESADGIAFPSSRSAGDNIVLFLGADSCIDLGATAQGSTALALDPSHLEVLRPAAAERVWQSRRLREVTRHW
jgi:hypothetical protein